MATGRCRKAGVCRQVRQACATVGMSTHWAVEQRWSRRGFRAWQGARRPNWGGAACPARLDMATGLGCKSEACGRERQACESVGMSTYWVKEQWWSKRGLGAWQGARRPNWGRRPVSSALGHSHRAGWDVRGMRASVASMCNCGHAHLLGGGAAVEQAGVGACRGLGAQIGGGAACPARLAVATGLGRKSGECRRVRQACAAVGMSTHWASEQRWSRRGFGAW